MGWSILLVCLQLVVLHSVSCAKLCSLDQSSALLNFKQVFSFHNLSSDYCSGWQRSYPKMKHWKEDGDCCLWDGVTCDRVTGHVIGLDLSCSWLLGTIPSNSSLFLLPHLQKLNLAFNDFSLSPIPSDFVRLKSLTHLNLSFSSFSGPIPLKISHLSKLLSLDLSSEFFGLSLETSVMKGLVQNMTDLKELVLDGVNMSTITPSYLTNFTSSLTLLSLADSNLQGSFPENIFHLPNLLTLNLNWNERLTGTFPKVNWSSPLRYLDVHSTKLSGELPYSIGNLKSLEVLDVEFCNLIGSVPKSIGNLTQLSYLHLGNNNFFGHIPTSFSNLEQLLELRISYNNFHSEIPNIFTNLSQLWYLDLSSNSLLGSIPSTVGRLRNLGYIFLHENSLDGTIPSGLFSLPTLKDISFAKNHLSGHIPEFQSKLLQAIDLRNNRLQGPIPSSVFELENLTHLLLTSNNLSGTVEFYMFGKLINLKSLYLSYNSLSIITKNKGNSSIPQLIDLALSSCNINEFPEILSTIDNLDTLDLSNNKIHGQIPNWLFNIDSLSSLNLSHNYLTSIERLTWKHLRILDLNSNLIQGLLPAPPTSIWFFSVSHNNLTRVIPSSFCNLSSMRYVDLSNNSLYGMIPQCLGNSSTISVLDLKMNNFHGGIPQTFANDSQLTTLNLNGNRLEGPLPHSLVNCRDLEVLDVGNNMINDIFPHWLATFPQLQVLILRSNRFHGALYNFDARLIFSKLRILDLAHNGFTGPLQMGFFRSFKAMMIGQNHHAKFEYMGDSRYQNSVKLTMKGLEVKLEKILIIFTTMDLSSNKFQGYILDVVGKLNSLKVLNFSHNNLIGQIPISLENLMELESLDLSSNKLQGNIPIQLTNLTFLSVLNFSYNQLVGPIPLGKQFNTFQNDSYIGNLGLCGLPLSKKCSNDVAPESEPAKFQESSSSFDWKIVMMGYGSGLVIGLSMGYIVFSTGKPWWFVSMVERKVLKLVGRNRRRN